MENKYIFGVCTYGDSPGISIKYLDDIIKNNGGKLAAGFAVKMPYNYIKPSFVLKDFFKSFKLREIPIEKQQEYFVRWKKRLDKIFKYINAQEKGMSEIKAKVIENIVDLLNLRETIQKSIWLKVAGVKEKTDLSFWESLRLMDNGFKSNDKCNNCGICSKICPVNNIKIVDSKPVWQHNCEQCFACLQWCPNEAIQFREGTLHGKRYHHPEVEVSDMIIKDKKN